MAHSLRYHTSNMRNYTNVRGLCDSYKQEQLANDMDKYKVDVCCLQETKMVEGTDVTVKGHKLICIPSEMPSYGNGFMIANKWTSSISKYWKVTDRIAIKSKSGPRKSDPRRSRSVK